MGRLDDDKLVLIFVFLARVAVGMVLECYSRAVSKRPGGALQSKKRTKLPELLLDLVDINRRRQLEIGVVISIVVRLHHRDVATKARDVENRRDDR